LNLWLQWDRDQWRQQRQQAVEGRSDPRGRASEVRFTGTKQLLCVSFWG